MKEKRREFFVLTAAAFLTGAVLYGAMGLYAALSGLAVWGQHTAPALAASTTALAGGYFFFSILSGILFTAHWLSGKTLRAKILLTVLFFIPIWLAMAGIFYSLPYGVYNFIQYRKAR
ncbi:MAG: hypothetical protein ACLVKK_05680 [Ruthenibacterium sp.]